MFVWINNTDMGLSDIEKWIKIARDDNGGFISPEFAMEILGKTNHLGHIKKVLANIKKNCTTKEEMAPYREFILSCVDEREMSDIAFDYLCVIADLCGCRKELDAANEKPKLYSMFDCEWVAVSTQEEFDALKGENLNVYFDAEVVGLDEYDLSKIKGLKFRKGAKVSLYKVKNLPKYLDVSMCDKISLWWCDLSGVEELKFKEGAEVNLSCAENLKEDLDVSMCNYVDLRGCDLSKFKNLKFKEGGRVCLIGATNFSECLDLSMCNYVDLRYCNFKGVKKIKFRDGAKVNFGLADKLPEELDVSMCSEVSFSECDLRGVKKIKFKNLKQKNESMRRAENFSGKVVSSIFGLDSKLKRIFNKGME